MKTTPRSIPEVIYRCGKHMNDELVNSTCLSDRIFNRLDAMAKKNHSHTLLQLIQKKKHKLKCKLVFMLQHSLYWHTPFIPTSQVSMPEDFNPIRSPQQSSAYSESFFHSAPPSLAPSRADFSTLSRYTEEANRHLNPRWGFPQYPTPDDDDHKRRLHSQLFPVAENDQQNSAESALPTNGTGHLGTPNVHSSSTTAFYHCVKMVRNKNVHLVKDFWYMWQIIQHRAQFAGFSSGPHDICP